MSKLQIDLRTQGDLTLSSVPITTHVLSSDFDVVHSLSVRGSTTVEVNPGHYIVRVTLPNGTSLAAQTDVTESPEKVTINLPPTRHEWMAWQSVLGELPNDLAKPVGGRKPGEVNSVFRQVQNVLPSEILQQVSREEDLFEDLWIRLWRQSGTQAKIYSANANNVIVAQHTSEGLLRLDIETPAPGLWYLQIGGKYMSWRFVMLPPTFSRLEVLIRLSQLPTILNGGLTVKISSLDHEFETLSHYMWYGSHLAAEVIADEIVVQAEEMFRQKAQNPMGAAVAGYYLLRIGALERLHNWPNNFANWIEWLPDSAIIHAWQIIYSDAGSQSEEAKSRLVEAVDRGIPVYTEGLRLLIDGLELFAENNPDAQEALKRIRPYARALDSNQRLTTFYGTTVENPSLEISRGIPENEGVLRLNGLR